VCKKDDLKFSTVYQKMSENRRLQGGDFFWIHTVDQSLLIPLRTAFMNYDLDWTTILTGFYHEMT